MIKRKSKIHLILFCFIISFVVIFVCSKNSPLYPFNDWVDENAFYTVGRAWGHGMIPYRDLFEQKGPLLYFLFMLASFIAPNSFLVIFILEVISYTVFLYYASKIVNLFLDYKYSYLIIPLFASIISSSIFFSYGGSAEELCLPMIMITLYKFLDYFYLKKELSNRDFFLTGLFAGSILMIKFTLLGFSFGFISLIMISFLMRGRYIDIIGKCSLFLMGMFIPFGLFSLYFIINNSFLDFIQAYFLFNIFSYGEKMTLGFRFIRMGIEFFKKLFHNKVSFVLISMGLCSNIIKKRDAKICLWLFFILGVVGIYWGCKNYFYYFLPVMIFNLFGLITIFKLLGGNMRVKMLKETFYGVIVLMVIFIFLSPNLKYAKNKREDLVQYKFAEVIKGEGGKSLLNYGFLDGGFYFASEILPSTRYFMKQNAKMPKADRELREMISDKKFDFIVIRRFIKSKKPIEREILENYYLKSREVGYNRNREYIYYLYQRI